MAETTGPISTLPGRRQDVPDGQMCDEHPDPAVARIQGETDSFGSELIDMCQDCLDEHKAYVANEDTSGKCEWCGNHAEKRRQARDYEEGMCGRVYEVCDPCLDRRNAEAKAELYAHGDCDDDFDDSDFYDEPDDTECDTPDYDEG